MKLSGGELTARIAVLACSLLLAASIASADDTLDHVRTQQQAAIAQEQSMRRTADAEQAQFKALSEKRNFYVEQVYLTLRSAGIAFDDPSEAIAEYNSSARTAITMSAMKSSQVTQIDDSTTHTRTTVVKSNNPDTFANPDSLAMQSQGTNFDSQVIYIKTFTDPTMRELAKAFAPDRLGAIAAFKASGVHDVITLTFAFYPFDADESGVPTGRCQVLVKYQVLNRAMQPEHNLAALPCNSMLDGSAVRPLAEAVGKWIGESLSLVEANKPVSVDEEAAFWQTAHATMQQTFQKNFKYWATSSEGCIIDLDYLVEIKYDGSVRTGGGSQLESLFHKQNIESDIGEYISEFVTESADVFRRIGRFDFTIPQNFGGVTYNDAYRKRIAVHAVVPLPKTKRLFGQVISGYDYDADCSIIRSNLNGQTVPMWY